MPNTFKVGPLYFHMYGLMIAIGLVAATLVSLKRAKKQGLSKDVLYFRKYARILLYCGIFLMDMWFMVD